MFARSVALPMIVALAVFAAIATPLAHADEGDLERARAHYQTGEALYAAGRYRAALAEFARADALVPSPVNSYNMALCHDELGEHDAAVQAYRAYLEAMPEAPNRREVEARIAALENTATRASEAQPSEEAGAPETAHGRDEPAPDPPSPRDEVADDPGGEAEASDRGADRTQSERGEAPDSEEGGATDRGYPATEPEPAAHPRNEPGPRREAKPLYKSGWFWAVAGVSAIILAIIVTDDSSADAANLELFEPASSGGMTLWRF